MRERLDPEITPSQRKGLDLTVKGMSKSYPFIIGYKDDESSNYEASHYIDLIIDTHKLSEYLGFPIIEYWNRYLDKKPEDSINYALWSYINFGEEHKDMNDISNHPGHLLQKDVESLIKSVYEYIPDTYKMKYIFGDEDKMFDDVIKDVNILINGYFLR